MKKIENLRLARLQSNEHGQFITEFCSLVNKFIAAVLGIEQQFEILKAKLAAEHTAQGVDQGSSLTEEIERLDALRDNTWYAISQRINGTLYCPIEAEVNSAKAIKRVLDLEGDVRNHAYSKETGELNVLLTKLLSAENSAHLTTLGMISWAKALKDENDQFQQVFEQRNTEQAGRPSGDTLAARREVDAEYYGIIDRINASITLQVARPEVADFVAELNNRIAYYQTTLNARAGRAAKNDKGAAPTQGEVKN